MSTVGRAERGWVVFRNPCCGPEGKLMGRGGRCRWEVTRATTQVGMGGGVQETKEGVGRRGERSHRAQGWASLSGRQHWQDAVIHGSVALPSLPSQEQLQTGLQGSQCRSRPVLSSQELLSLLPATRTEQHCLFSFQARAPFLTTQRLCKPSLRVTLLCALPQLLTWHLKAFCNIPSATLQPSGAQLESWDSHLLTRKPL